MSDNTLGYKGGHTFRPKFSINEEEKKNEVKTMLNILETNDIKNLFIIDVKLGKPKPPGDWALPGLLNYLVNENCKLKELDLIRCSIDDSGAEAIAEALKKNTTLEILNLYSNGFKDKGAEAIAEALKTNKTLEEINLYGNEFSVTGAEAIVKALEENTTLKTIFGFGQKKEYDRAQGFNGPKDDKDVRVPSEAELTLLKGEFKINKHMNNFAIWDTFPNSSLGDTKVKYVADALKVINTLETLTLSNDDIHDDGAIAIADALVHENCKLKILDLSENKIGDAGIVAIAEALNVNETLEKIDLRHNKYNKWNFVGGAESGNHALQQVKRKGLTIYHMYSALQFKPKLKF